jgi:anaerobic selenocysteine-containing dehydrogenase
MLATVDGGRVTHLRGDPDHPVTRGFLCYRTNHFLERQYSAERLGRPLMRRDGRFHEAGWEEALDRIASKLRETLRHHGPPAILHYQSGGSLGILKALNRYFFELLGPVTFKRGDICSGAGDAAQETDMGLEDAHDLDDLANSRTIILWGKNVAETGVHLIPYLRQARARGAYVAQIDPVHSRRTLHHCDGYHQVRPGGDGALALGMARVILDSGWADPAAPGYCDHFEAFSRLAHRHSVAQWAERADLPEPAVRELAERYARDTPAAIFVGWGLGRRLHGSTTIRLIDALGAITGNIGRPGGGVSYYFPRRKGFDTAFAERPENAGSRTLLEPLLGEEILRADPPIRLAVIDNANPVSQLPDSNTVARALSSVDFLVVIDPFLTDTAELADVVLPTTTMLESHEILGAFGHPHVQMARPVTPPPPGILSDLEIYQQLAERMGIGGALAGSHESWIDRLLAPMAKGGVTREALAKGGVRKPDAPTVLFPDRTFATPTGRFNLITEFAGTTHAPDVDYPLTLMSISTYRLQASQQTREAQRDPPEVIVHPDAAPGRSDGELARLLSPIAEVTVRVRFDPMQRPDVVIFHKGRWAKFGGPNTLVQARTTDHGGGAAYYDQGVRIE